MNGSQNKHEARNVAVSNQLSAVSRKTETQSRKSEIRNVHPSCFGFLSSFGLRASDSQTLTSYSPRDSQKLPNRLSSVYAQAHHPQAIGKPSCRLPRRPPVHAVSKLVHPACRGSA